MEQSKAMEYESRKASSDVLKLRNNRISMFCDLSLIIILREYVNKYIKISRWKAVNNLMPAKIKYIYFKNFSLFQNKKYIWAV
jgi:hypothetical protein